MIDRLRDDDHLGHRSSCKAWPAAGHTLSARSRPSDHPAAAMLGRHSDGSSKSMLRL
jgi:hypothetical protein